MENYIVINGKKTELTEEALDALRTFDRFAQMAKEQFGLTITQKEPTGETFKTLFGVDFSDCSERKNPFNSKLEDSEEYFIIDSGGVKPFLHNYYDVDVTDSQRLNNINSFNDKDFAYQIYLHELLERKLLKYAWDNEAEDCEWNGENCHWRIYHNEESNEFAVRGVFVCKEFHNYFSKQEVAKQAIRDVVEPFIKNIQILNGKRFI